MKKLRLWRFLQGVRLDEVACWTRLPTYIVSAIERGEVAPSERWRGRFAAVFGPRATAAFFEDADTFGAIGPVLAATSTPTDTPPRQGLAKTSTPVETAR